LRLELIEVLEKTRQMVFAAHRCKSPGYAEKDHFTAFENLIRGPSCGPSGAMTVNVAFGIGSPLWIAIVAPKYRQGLMVRENAAVFQESQRRFLSFFRALVRGASVHPARNRANLRRSAAKRQCIFTGGAA
jgi:hypothetical protein